MLGLTPIEPLYIGVSVPSVVQIKGGNPDSVLGRYEYYENDAYFHAENGKTIIAPAGLEPKTAGNVAHTYEKIQVGAGFTIANIGLIRAQYVGASYIYGYTENTGWADIPWQDNTKARRIEAAFAFTGMEGLVVDVGAKIPLAFKTIEYTDAYSISKDGKTTPYSVRVEGDTTYQAPYQVSLGAGYTAGALDVKGRVDAQFAGSAKDDKNKTEDNLGLNINAHLTPSYNLGFATAGLDVGFEFLGEDTDKDGKVQPGTNAAGEAIKKEGGYRFGVGAWLRKAYGGASIKGGLGVHLGEVHGTKEAMVISVPIIFDYSF
jgi:hypothetical protein